jgi:hypothetical protein
VNKQKAPTTVQQITEAKKWPVAGPNPVRSREGEGWQEERATSCESTIRWPLLQSNIAKVIIAMIFNGYFDLLMVFGGAERVRQ